MITSNFGGLSFVKVVINDSPPWDQQLYLNVWYVLIKEAVFDVYISGLHGELRRQVHSTVSDIDVIFVFSLCLCKTWINSGM